MWCFLVLLVLALSWRLYGVVLSEGLVDSDALELGFALGFLTLDIFVMSEVLEIFWMVVSFIRLCLRC